MAINVSRANSQANSMVDNINQLREGKRYLEKYRSEINAAWQGREVTYYVNAINTTISKIDAVIRDMERIANEVKTTANQIKKEEEAAAAAAAAAARNRRIQAAQAELDNARREYDALMRERQALEALMKKSARERIRNAARLQDLNNRIRAAEHNVNAKNAALQAARR